MPPSSRRQQGPRGPNREYFPFGNLNASDDPAPEPTPFPIRIIDSTPADDASSPPDDPPKDQDSKTKSDDFYAAWDRFIIAQPRRAKRAQRAAKDLDKEKKLVENAQPEGLHFKVNAAQSWEDAANECRLKVAAIVEECKRLNQKYRDALFDLEDSFDCLQGLAGSLLGVDASEQPPWIKRVVDIFDKPQFIVEGESTADIHQGRLGDCWFLSALTSVSADKRILENLCVAKDETVGVYGFVFYRDGEWVHEVIDDKLYIRVGDDDRIDVVANYEPYDKGSSVTVLDTGRQGRDKLKDQLQKGGEALFFSHSKSEETWVPLIEKAYAKAHGDYTAIDGGWPSEAIEDLTGGVATSINPEDIMDKDKFWHEQLREVNKKYLFNCATGWSWRGGQDKGLASSHAYTILETWDEGDLKLVKVRNPWGEYEWKEDWSDGSKQWTPEMMKKLNHTFGDDGIFWISYKDLLKNFPSLHRVRLFDHEWHISQRWTCVNVPWTVDYMDTKFEIDVATKGPLVIVLAQPDERYFRGLGGRFDFALHFRVYRAGELGQRYLVRSMHSSGDAGRGSRSVSAELDDVEPGKYFVIFKVIANRNEFAERAEDAIVSFATWRKEKLTAVGRRFDYAQTKGNLRAMEESERKRLRTENFDKAIKAMKRLRKNNKLQRQRDRLRKKRLDNAVTAQRKAIFDRAAEKRKADKAKQDAEKSADSSAQQTVTAAPASTTTSEGSQVVLTPSTEGASGVEKPAEPQASAGASTETPASSTDKAVEQATSDVAQLAIAADTSKEIPAADAPKSEASATTSSATDVPKGEASIAASSAPTAPVADQPASAPVPGPQDAADLQWEDPPELPDDLEDDDFDWNSTMDGPLNSDTSSRTTEAGKDIDIFADDPWHALCVIGLRVYSKGDVKIEVRTATEDAEDDVEVV